MSKYGKAALAAALLLGPQLSNAAAAEPSKANYPSVFDQPTTRGEHGLTADERSKLKQDLTNARDRQGSKTKANDQAGQPKPKSQEKQSAH
jgi:hypothetical protein